MTLAYNMYRAAEAAAAKAAAEAVAKAVAEAREKALKEGREKALKEGREEGIAIGLSQAKIETAKKFLAMGLSVEQVADGTGLSVEEIEKL